MKVSLSNLKSDEVMMAKLATAYRNSYNKLSEAYKSPEEMALYTLDYFQHKVKRFALENEKSSLSRTFVVSIDEEPVGFVRYSKIPEYYKENPGKQTQELEHGMMDGYEYSWYRKVKFVDNVKLDDSTMILNQIYLDPSVQRFGLGTYIMEQTLPKMKEMGVRNLILEYNSQNTNAEKFYGALGFAALADTQDLDHIIKGKDGHTKFCISDVKMVHVPVNVALEKAKTKMDLKRQEHANRIGHILIGLRQHAQKNK